MNNTPIRIREQPQTKCQDCAIRRMALFQGVPEERLQWTQKYRQHQFIVPRKTLLYIEGSKPDYVYTLFNGWMAMHQTLLDGERKIMRFALPGDFLGFQADANGIISHSVQALTESIVCGFPRSTLREMLEDQPTLALRLATMEARDMSLCQHHQMFGSRKNSEGSIAFLLLELFHRARRQMSQDYNPSDNSIAFPLTQEEIGDSVGLTNVHVNRVIRQFVKNGLLQCKHKRLKIIDEPKLSKIGQFSVNLISGNPLGYAA